MGEDRLTQDEVALVLRRAAELDVPDDGADGLPVAAVEAAAAEVGVPPEKVRQAVAELRAGMLTGRDDSAFDPGLIVEAAVLPMEPERALAEVGRWLEAQTFHRHRGRDGVEVWRVREDWIAGLQRTFDWSASVRLKDVREVVVQAVAVEGGTLVRLQVDVAGATNAAPGIGASAGAVPGALIGVGTVAATGPPGLAAAGAGIAGLGAAGGWLAGRAVRRNRRGRIADELAAELDRLASGLTAEATALDRLRRRARGFGGGRWA